MAYYVGSDSYAVHIIILLRTCTCIGACYYILYHHRNSVQSTMYMYIIHVHVCIRVCVCMYIVYTQWRLNCTGMCIALNIHMSHRVE